MPLIGGYAGSARPPTRRIGASGVANSAAPGMTAPNPAMDAWKANDALNQEQEKAAFRASYNANSYGVSTQAKGQSPTGSWAIGAEPQTGDGASPVLTRARRAGGGGAGGGGGGDYGYEDLTASNYSSALNQIPGAAPTVSPISMMSRRPAEDAAYGRAKDQAGSEARGAADSLSDEMSARGIAGSGVEGALLGGILQKGQGQLGEVNRQQAVDYMKRADTVQDTNYQGAVQQRGQTLGADQARTSNAMRLAELLRRRRVTPQVA